jgi:hypothetical protein
MKKIFVSVLMVIMILCFSVFVFAEDTELPTEDTELTETAETYIETDTATDTAAPVIKGEGGSISDQLSSYLSKDGATVLIDEIIAMGKQLEELEAQGYTFKERLVQLITPENIVTTAAAAFFIVGGLVLLFTRKRQMNTVDSLNESYLIESDENQKLREKVKDMSLELTQLRQEVSELRANNTDNSKQMKEIASSSKAVADMVKDVFLCSKTLNAEGKSLVVTNYLKAYGEEKNDTEAQTK